MADKIVGSEQIQGTERSVYWCFLEDMKHMIFHAEVPSGSRCRTREQVGHICCCWSL